MTDTLTDRLATLAARIRTRYWSTRHRDTDPACVYYQPPRRGSRRDRRSRGRGCNVCLMARRIAHQPRIGDSAWRARGPLDQAQVDQLVSAWRHAQGQARVVAL